MCRVFIDRQGSKVFEQSSFEMKDNRQGRVLPWDLAENYTFSNPSTHYSQSSIKSVCTKVNSTKQLLVNVVENISKIIYIPGLLLVEINQGLQRESYKYFAFKVHCLFSKAG